MPIEVDIMGNHCPKCGKPSASPPAEVYCVECATEGLRRDEPRIAFAANRLGDEPYLTFNGEIVGMTEWVRSVEARLATYAGATEALEEIKRVAAIEAPPVSDEVPAKVWKIAFDALNHLRGQ